MCNDDYKGHVFDKPDLGKYFSVFRIMAGSFLKFVLYILFYRPKKFNKEPHTIDNDNGLNKPIPNIS
ncbi:hypothetical protein CQA01_17220 [Cyclobacterium qasimii]|uniref:Uncharacterized protein n=1 Tax=Cyclobacterium qasimii TaxID=1350429 RepID=A0A512CAF5_9BACT|nr:hypothetical protein CQA01_17220 [Cyclobacterium qasimii]